MAEPRERVLNRSVLSLGFVSLLADISGDMLYPVTPVFLSSVLGASMASVGMVEGCAEASASLLKLYSGAWSDRTGKRKIFVVLGYLIAALAKPLTGIASAWPHVLFARSLDRFGKGLRTAPRDALLAEAVSEKSRGLVFGWHRAMDSMGAALGPLVTVYFLSQDPSDLRRLYLWALIPGLLAVLLSLTVPERAGVSRPASGLFPSWKLIPSKFRLYLLVWALFSLANSSDAFLLLRARDAGFDLKGTVLLYCAYNCLYSLASPYLGGLSDLIGRKQLLIGGLVIFAFVYLGFAWANAPWQIWLLFMFYGLYMAATDGAGKALALDLMPKDRKATAIGAFGMVTGFSALFASFVAGLLWDHFGPAAPFLYGSAGAVLAIFLLPLIRD